MSSLYIIYICINTNNVTNIEAIEKKIPRIEAMLLKSLLLWVGYVSRMRKITFSGTNFAANSSLTIAIEGHWRSD